MLKMLIWKELSDGKNGIDNRNWTKIQFHENGCFSLMTKVIVVYFEEFFF